MKIIKKNQVVIFVIALMLVTAGYLNFTNQQNLQQNLLPTGSLADSEQMAAIGDATLVSANQISEKNNTNESNTITSNTEQTNTNVIDNKNNTIESNSNSTNANVVAETNNNQNTDDHYFIQSKLDRDNMYSQTL